MTYRLAKVVATTDAPRVLRERTGLCGSPLGYFAHSQKFENEDDLTNLIQLTVEVECATTPGLPTDLIFVDNSPVEGSFSEKLSSLEGYALPDGRVRVITRHGPGRSYGSYSRAFQEFRCQYSHFLFTEDDILIHGRDYGLIGVEQLARGFDFVAYQGISKIGLGLRRLIIHGGVGIAKSESLGEIYSSYGMLPHSTASHPTPHQIILEGEIGLSEAFEKLGMRVGEIPRRLKLYEYAYDYQRGLKVPRYANMPDVTRFVLKKWLVRLRDNIRKSLQDIIKRGGK